MGSKVEAEKCEVRILPLLSVKRIYSHGVAHFPKVTKECVGSFAYFGPSFYTRTSADIPGIYIYIMPGSI